MPTRRRDDRRSPEAAKYRSLYKGQRWARLRYQQLLAHPLCERCLRATPSRLVAADVVHHIEAHRGNVAKFYDPANLASSCKPCHDSDEQSEERLGYSREIGLDGWPRDAAHPANACPVVFRRT
jgi:5-methylcytosine-specific restriction endonuclease McrA